MNRRTFLKTMGLCTAGYLSNLYAQNKVKVTLKKVKDGSNELKADVFIKNNVPTGGLELLIRTDKNLPDLANFNFEDFGNLPDMDYQFNSKRAEGDEEYNSAKIGAFPFRVVDNEKETLSDYTPGDRYFGTLNLGNISDGDFIFSVKAPEALGPSYIPPEIKFEDFDEEPQTGDINDFKVYQNYPNPFKSITTIDYDLKERAKVFLEIYDIKGGKVFDYDAGHQEAGKKSLNLNLNLASGIYFYNLRAGNEFQAKRMVVVK